MIPFILLLLPPSESVVLIWSSTRGSRDFPEPTPRFASFVEMRTVIVKEPLATSVHELRYPDRHDVHNFDLEASKKERFKSLTNLWRCQQA